MIIRIYIAGQVRMHDLEGDAPPDRFELPEHMRFLAKPKALMITFDAPVGECVYMGLGGDGVPEYEVKG